MSRLLRGLVRLFPAAFREQFGVELEAELRQEYDRAQSGGRLSAWVFTLATAADLIRSALAERLDPAWVPEPDVGLEDRGRRGGLMRGWTNELRHSIRALRRRPGFTAIAVGTLGLAIGVNAGIFSVVDTVLLRPLPYEDADRLAFIAASAPGSDYPEEFPVAIEFLIQYSEESQLLTDVSFYNSFTNTLRVGDRTERVLMSAPSISLFETLGVAPLLGRLPVADDEDRVMVISYALWTTWFGSDPDVLGKSYYTSIGGMRTVVGVMGPEFRFPNDRVLLWVPSPPPTGEIVPGRFGVPLVARMAPGATHEAVRRELGILASRLPERFGGSASYARLIEQHRPVVRSLREEMLGAVSMPLLVLLGSASIVLLIACANVANLFMVRSQGRQRDMAVRRAIGAGRAQLFRTHLTEAGVVAACGGVLAVILATITVPAFLRVAPPDIPRIGDVGITLLSVLFTFGMAIVAALLSGLGPAVRFSSPNLAGLRDGSRGSTRRRHAGRDALVIAQTALALVLLIGSGLLVRSFQKLRDVDPGYDTENIFTFQVAPEGAALTDGPSYASFHMSLVDRILALPGVESVGLIENVPLNEGTASSRFRTADDPDSDGGSMLNFTFAGVDYFETMGIDVLGGRSFRRSDHVSDLGNIVVSRTAADLLWPGENAIGRRVRADQIDAWFTVVGVVEDVLQYGFRDTPEPLVYLPLVGPAPDAWMISSPAYVVRTPRAETIAPEIRALVRDVAPEAPMYRTFTMAGLAADSMLGLSFTMLTLGVTSLLALFLGTIGLYGVLSSVVAERTREIGVRMALGAEARKVRAMIVGQGARVIVIGVVIGVAIALASTRALDGLLFGVEAVDAATFAGVSATMVLVGFLASYLPARRASSVDPIESLRDG